MGLLVANDRTCARELPDTHAMREPSPSISTNPAGACDVLGWQQRCAATPMTKTVLVVDDDRDIREAVGMCLENEGYCVHCVGSAAAALTAVEAPEPPDLVILDMTMPGVGGWGVLAAMLDTNRIAGRIPVLIMTALPEVSAPRGRPTLHKPFGPSQLVASVRAMFSAESESSDLGGLS